MWLCPELSFNIQKVIKPLIKKHENHLSRGFFPISVMNIVKLCTFYKFSLLFIIIIQCTTLIKLGRVQTEKGHVIAFFLAAHRPRQWVGVRVTGNVSSLVTHSKSIIKTSQQL